MLASNLSIAKEYMTEFYQNYSIKPLAKNFY